MGSIASCSLANMLRVSSCGRDFGTIPSRLAVSLRSRMTRVGVFSRSWIIHGRCRWLARRAILTLAVSSSARPQAATIVRRDWEVLESPKSPQINTFIVIFVSEHVLNRPRLSRCLTTMRHTSAGRAVMTTFKISYADVCASFREEAHCFCGPQTTGKPILRKTSSGPLSSCRCSAPIQRLYKTLDYYLAVINRYTSNDWTLSVSGIASNACRQLRNSALDAGMAKTVEAYHVVPCHLHVFQSESV